MVRIVVDELKVAQAVAAVRIEDLLDRTHGGPVYVPVVIVVFPDPFPAAPLEIERYYALLHVGLPLQAVGHDCVRACWLK